MKRKIILIATTAMILTGCNYTYSDGTRSGIVDKFSYKGFICKSYEGELNRGGVTNTGDGLIANTFKFSVKSESIVREIEKAAQSGKRVTLTYDQKALPEFCGRKTDYVVTKVTYIN